MPIEARIPSWPPNWLKPGDYECLPDDAGKYQWAWQFLRRNEDYQGDYKKWLELEPTSNDVEKRAFLIGVKKKYLLNTDYLCGMVNPADYWPKAIAFVQAGRGPALLRAGAGVFSDEDKVSISFSTSIPFDRQVEKARWLFDKWINEYQPLSEIKNPKLQKTSYPDYLRVYDAHKAGAKASSIILEVFGSLDAYPSEARRRQYARHTKTARHLIDQLGYIDAILLTQ